MLPAGEYSVILSHLILLREGIAIVDVGLESPSRSIAKCALNFQ